MPPDLHEFLVSLLSNEVSHSSKQLYLIKNSSRETFQELVEVLNRKKFKKYISSETRQIFLKSLQKVSIEVFPNESIKASRDIKDNMFLECAVSGHADYIVSGDIHLLELKQFQGIKILSFAEFLKVISKQ